MTWPFAGFGSMVWEDSEKPIRGSDTRWVPGKPVLDQSHPLGAAVDDIQLLGRASPTREFEAYFEESRLTVLEALVATWGTLVDWTPSPDNTTGERWRCRLRFVGQ